MTQIASGLNASQTTAAPQVEMQVTTSDRPLDDARPTDSQLSQHGEASFGPFRVILSRQLLLHGETPLHLGSRAYGVLLALIENAGQIVDKETLMARAWGRVHVEECNLRTAIANVRRALNIGTKRVFVATVQGRGYRFLAPVTFASGRISRNALRKPLSKVIGRDEEILRLLEDIGRHRLITVVGAGGIGKTTVALSAAHLALGRDLIGEVALVDLSAVEHPDLVPDAIRVGLGIGAHSDDSLNDIGEFLSNRSYLIVLDGCERVVAAVADIAERMLAVAPNAVVLTTSREPLRADGERIHRLGPLALPDDSCTCAVNGPKLGSIELFVERAAACVTTFELTETTVPIVAKICRQLDGNPLAIELAANRLDVFDLPVLADLLDGHFCLHMLGRITSLPRHRTLSATLDWSFETLTDEEKTVFRRLSVFGESFSFEAARVIVSDELIAPSDVTVIIARLSAKSVISTGAGRAQGEHKLFHITRAYALDKLRQSGEREIFIKRHAEYSNGVVEHGAIERDSPYL
jgi:predicted ATPase/DNA-binding winged helix-turn-helix (wHTH) protein